ncbi:MAG TPA: hypothetical protein VGK71_00065 [Nitrospirota bacterium]|jgi:hypothetical protein
MDLQVDVRQVEDEILDPLARILYLTYGSEHFPRVTEEVKTMIKVMVRYDLIGHRQNICLSSMEKKSA